MKINIIKKDSRIKLTFLKICDKIRKEEKTKRGDRMKLRTIKIRVKDKKVEEEYKEKMKEAKEFYNSCLYLTRFRYFEFIGNVEKLNYEARRSYDVEDWFNNEEVFIGNYFSYGGSFIKKVQEAIGTKLKLKDRQTILRKVCTDWNAYFKTKEAMKDTDVKVNIPGYKRYDYLICEFDYQMLKFSGYKEKRTIGFLGVKSRIKAPEWLKEEEIQAARFKYKNNYLYVEIIYKKEDKKSRKGLKEKVAAIDPGLNSIATMTFSWMKKPIAIRGKHLKSINQLYNKTVAELNEKASKYEKTKEEAKAERIKELIVKVTEKRNLRVEHELHKISKEIVRMLKKESVSKLIFGHNKGQKTEINIGKRNNQNFVNIPYNKLISYLKYKCEDAGIEFELQEESYTSKASFLSNDDIPTYVEEDNNKYSFSGTRRRGIYTDNKHNLKIHSDVNGSYNIMRKNGVDLSKLQKIFIITNKTIEPVGMRFYI